MPRVNQWKKILLIVSQHNKQNYADEEQTQPPIHSVRDENLDIVHHGEISDVIYHVENSDIVHHIKICDINHHGENCDVIHHGENYDVILHGKISDVINHGGILDVIHLDESLNVTRHSEISDVIHHGENRDIIHHGENCNVIHHGEVRDVIYYGDNRDVINHDGLTHCEKQIVYSYFNQEEENVSSLRNCASLGVVEGHYRNINSHESVGENTLKLDVDTLIDVDSGLSELDISNHDDSYRGLKIVMGTPPNFPHESNSEPNQIEATQKISVEDHAMLRQSKAVKEIIDDVWREINDSVPEYLKKYRMKNYKRTEEWKVVRIFISSTFTDFFAEREVIVKKVTFIASLNIVFLKIS